MGFSFSIDIFKRRKEIGAVAAELADGVTKDSLVTTFGKHQQHQHHSNAASQTSVLHKPLHPAVPASVLIAIHVVSEHLMPHPQGKLSFMPNSVNAISQYAPSSYHKLPPTPSHTSVTKQQQRKQKQQQHPNALSIYTVSHLSCQTTTTATTTTTLKCCVSPSSNFLNPK
eukprot:15365237-Ditylum_brightwellii.AAC.1